MSQQVAGILVAAILMAVAVAEARRLRRELREGVAYSHDDEGRVSAVVERATTPWRFRASVLGMVLLIALLLALATLAVWLPMSGVPPLTHSVQEVD